MDANYPMRINKYLSSQNYCSRREADGFIKAGMVKINGRIAVLGDKVSENDKEGKKHQIRRMCDTLGFVVKDLQRIRIMNIGLKDLKPNQYREIKGKELETFLSDLGL